MVSAVILLQAASLNMPLGVQIPDASLYASSSSSVQSISDEQEWVELPVKAGELIKAGTTIYVYPDSSFSFRDPNDPDADPITHSCGKGMAKFGVSVAYDCLIVTATGKITKEIKAESSPKRNAPWRGKDKAVHAG